MATLKRIVCLANPNNPTGTIFTRQQFDDFYRHVPERVLIILDEAYFEYAKDNPRYPDSMHYRYDNVITLRTFSKVYGLAGVRIGYGFAHEELIRNLLKVKLPFEPSTPAQAAGIGALSDYEFLHRSLEQNARALRYLTSGLQELGIDVVPSAANFLMAVLPGEQEAFRIFHELLAQGVVVRPLKAFGLRDSHPLIIRGTKYLLEEQNEDGSWGDPDEESIRRRCHTTWTAIDGLRNYAWRAERLSRPQVRTMLKQC